MTFSSAIGTRRFDLYLSITCFLRQTDFLRSRSDSFHGPDPDIRSSVVFHLGHARHRLFFAIFFPSLAEVFVQQDPVGERLGRGVPGGVFRAVPVPRIPETGRSAESRKMPPDRHRRGRQRVVWKIALVSLSSLFDASDWNLCTKYV